MPLETRQAVVAHTLCSSHTLSLPLSRVLRPCVCVTVHDDHSERMQWSNMWACVCPKFFPSNRVDSPPQNQCHSARESLERRQASWVCVCVRACVCCRPLVAPTPPPPHVILVHLLKSEPFFTQPPPPPLSLSPSHSPLPGFILYTALARRRVASGGLVQCSRTDNRRLRRKYNR